MANFLNSIFMVGRRLFRKAKLRKVSEFMDTSQEDFLLKTGYFIPQYFISEMSEAFYEFDKVSDMIRRRVVRLNISLGGKWMYLLKRNGATTTGSWSESYHSPGK